MRVFGEIFRFTFIKVDFNREKGKKEMSISFCLCEDGPFAISTSLLPGDGQRDLGGGGVNDYLSIGGPIEGLLARGP